MPMTRIPSALGRAIVCALGTTFVCIAPACGANASDGFEGSPADGSSTTVRTSAVNASPAAGGATTETASAALLAAAPTPVTASIGTNLGAISDSTPEFAFIDVMKSSRAWISGSTAGAWDDGRAVDVDENGWVRSLAPGQVARTLMFWDLGDRYPRGRYVVLYQGKGTLGYGAGARLDAARSTAGRDEIDVGLGGLELTITSIDPADPLRNIRVIVPGGVCSNDTRRYCDAATACSAGATCQSFEQSHAEQIFHPAFLERIASYGALRFMDWGDTNDSAQRTWAERPKVSDARYSIKGAPVEVMVELSNRLGIDPWFTIPHMADDAYVAAYAKLVKQRIRPDLTVYVEYSNEVWNGIFRQSEYARANGVALGLGADSYEAQLRYHSQRSVQVFELFSKQFTVKGSLLRVLASHAANAWASNTILDFENAASNADALAIAPYFAGDLGTPAQASRIRGLGAEGVLNEIEQRSLPEAIGWMNEQAQTAAAHGVRLIAYEGGQHLAGVDGVQDDAALNAVFDAVNRHPRMKSIYLRYLDAWRNSGGGLFTHFVNCGPYTKWGRWGALERLDQPRAAAPKFDALMTFLESE